MKYEHRSHQPHGDASNEEDEQDHPFTGGPEDLVHVVYQLSIALALGIKLGQIQVLNEEGVRCPIKEREYLALALIVNEKVCEHPVLKPYLNK